MRPLTQPSVPRYFGLLFLWLIVLVGPVQANTTTSTTIVPIEQAPTPDSGDAATSAPATSSGFLESNAEGNCRVKFQLNDDTGWASLRFIAAYDRHHGRFTGPAENVDCDWSGVFDANKAENHSGVLQIRSANPDGLRLVQGPVEIAACNFAYDVAPDPSRFIIQVQEAQTVIPIEVKGGLPTVSVTVDCNDKR